MGATEPQVPPLRFATGGMTKGEGWLSDKLEGEACGIPHLAKNERDAPNFLYAALDKTACAPLFKERRMKFREPTKLHRRLGMWGTQRLWGDRA
jgi:hypothetical protein